MPELPDVEGFKRVLVKNALHKTIDRVVVSDARILAHLSPRTFASRLRGATLVAARRHGKHLMAKVDRLMNGSATGFVFDEAEPRVLLEALQRAAALWRNKIAWGRLQRNGMLQDFSWDRSARRYVDLYRTTARRGEPRAWRSSRELAPQG